MNMRALRSLLMAATAILPITAFAASITGTVTNKTTNKPAAGDDVVLIRLQQGMQDSTRTKTDARGHFTLDVPDDGVHLVRVTHDKANYFHPAPPGTQTVDVDVYNAAAHVVGVTGEADVMRIETDASGKNLNVVENFFIKNDSNPPLTQFSDRPFEFYLPEGAVVQGSAALGPNSMPVQSAPVPLGDKGHFTFLFPIRPGQTRFQISYSLPYMGSFSFAPKVTLPTDTVALMLPKTMKFKPGPSTPYTAINDDENAQTFVARNVSPSQPLEFSLSGEGQLPRDTAAAQQGGNAAQPDTSSAGGASNEGPNAGPNASTDTRPGGGLGTPIDTPDPLSKYKWWILGGLALVLAAGAGFLLSRPAAPVAVAADGAAGVPSAAGGDARSGTATIRSATVLDVLKDELFALETERLSGRLTDVEYAQQKGALEIVLRRALSRSTAT